MVINNKICKVDDCIKRPSINSKSLLCGMHQDRWRRYKSYDLPGKELIPIGYVKKCKVHGYLRLDQTRKRPTGSKNTYLACKICSNSQACNKPRTPEEKDIRKKQDLLNMFEIKNKSRRSKLKKYDLTENEYNNLLLLQENTCAICKKPENAIDKRTKKARNLAIDHCHKSDKEGVMKVRGLLCGKCNTAFGLFNDSVEIITNALDYAKKHGC